MLLAMAALAVEARAQAPAPAADGWRSFEGSWSASGHRYTIPAEGDRVPAIVQLSGAVVLTGAEGLGKGFRGEVIGFDDGQSAGVGRWVWTDERGDRIFGEIQGEPMATGRRFAGTITSGTGRYAGIAGDFTFTWQYVVVTEDGGIQGRTASLKGRYRTGRVQP